MVTLSELTYVYIATGLLKGGLILLFILVYFKVVSILTAQSTTNMHSYRILYSLVNYCRYDIQVSTKPGLWTMDWTVDWTVDSGKMAESGQTISLSY